MLAGRSILQGKSLLLLLLHGLLQLLLSIQFNPNPNPNLLYITYIYILFFMVYSYVSYVPEQLAYTLSLLLQFDIDAYLCHSKR